MKLNHLGLILILLSTTVSAQVAVKNDTKAVEIAEKCMKAMGGKSSWDNTKVIQWDFFGKRRLTWDKFDQEVKIERLGNSPNPYTIWVNTSTQKGRAVVNNVAVEHPDSLTVWLKRGYEIWINDSYWLVMPFKLRDKGVSLQYLGKMKNAAGVESEVLELTFEKVGVTPDNKYWVYFDPFSYLVNQWSYFEKYTDTEPKLTTPWESYEKYGNILLSSGRGKGKLENIVVKND